MDFQSPTVIVLGVSVGHKRKAMSGYNNISVPQRPLSVDHLYCGVFTQRLPALPVPAAFKQVPSHQHYSCGGSPHFQTDVVSRVSRRGHDWHLGRKGEWNSDDNSSQHPPGSVSFTRHSEQPPLEVAFYQESRDLGRWCPEQQIHCCHIMQDWIKLVNVHVRQCGKVSPPPVDLGCICLPH